MEETNNTDIREKGIQEVKKIGGGFKNQFSEFTDFIRKQGVVGFAVGFILGGAVSALVASIVTNLVNPVLNVVLGGARNLADSYWSFFGSNIMYGKLLNDLINFFAIAFVVYFGVKKIGLDKLDKPKQ